MYYKKDANRIRVFSQWLKSVAKQKGFESQRQLSIAADVSAATISRIWNETQLPDEITLKKLAPALKTPVEEVFKQAGYILPELTNPQIFNAIMAGRENPPPTTLTQARRDYCGEPKSATDEAVSQIVAALNSDPELLAFWNELSKRDDLQLLFKQTKSMTPESIRKVMRIIKAIEEEEVGED